MSTLQEYLVELGFKVDDASYRRFIKPIEEAAKTVVGLGEAMFATAAAVFVSVDQIARHYERLYYSAQRTGQSVQFLQQYRFAAQQIGLTAEDATAAVEGMAAAIRLNPGLRGLAGGAQSPADLVGQLRSRFGETGYFVASRFGQMFGIDENTFRMMWLNLDRLKREEVSFRERQHRMGVDSKTAAQEFTEFGRSVNTLTSNLGLLTDRWAIDLLPSVKQGVSIFDQMIFALADIDKKTNGWAFTIGTILVPGLLSSILKIGLVRTSIMALKGGFLALAGLEVFKTLTETAKGREPGKYESGEGMDPTSKKLDAYLRSVLSPFGVEPGVVVKTVPVPASQFTPPTRRPTRSERQRQLRDNWGDPEADPTQAFPPLGSGATGKQSSLNQTTTITVHGAGDPHDTARKIADLQIRVNGDLVRNLRGVTT